MKTTKAQRLFTRAITAALKAKDTGLGACARGTMTGLWRRFDGDVDAIAAYLGTSARSVQRYLVAAGVRSRDDERVNKRYRRRLRKTKRSKEI